MPQCPCAELFKIGDDYTREHHELCTANNDGRIFAPTTPPGQKPEWWGVESMQVAAPVPDYRITGEGRIINERLVFDFSVDGYCPTCHQDYSAIASQVAETEIQWSCPHCGVIMSDDLEVFNS